MTTVDKLERVYLPAAGRDWALPLYDPLVELIGAGKVHKELIEQANLTDGMSVLDIGCGTGTLAVRIKRSYGGVRVVGLDPDPKALERAKRKGPQASVSIQFDQGFADELPYDDGSFDRVFSSFMFHHLGSEDRPKTLAEVRRVLSPSGSFHMVDFAHGPPLVHMAGKHIYLIPTRI